MSTFELLFPSDDQIKKTRELFSKVELDRERGVYRPTEAAVRAAWNEIVEADSVVNARKSSER